MEEINILNYNDPVTMEIDDDEDRRSNISTGINESQDDQELHVHSSNLPTPPLNSTMEHDENSTQSTYDQEPEISKESPVKKRPIDSDDDNDDDGKLCPICLDNWTSSGEHRICALKCGHLFGLKCVNHWFDIQKNKTCPTCKKKVGRNSIRFIYAKKLIAVDTTEIEYFKKEIDELTNEKNRIQVELTKSFCREHMLTSQVQELKQQISNLTTALEMKQKFSHSKYTHTKTSTSNETVTLYMDKTLEICKSGGCRVLDANSKLDLVVASIKSPSTLFSGYGIRKVNVSNYKPTAFIQLHSNTIRDIRFHPQNELILTVSLDKTIKVVDSISNSTSHTISAMAPLWSCCWDANNSNVLFAGTAQGNVMKYDIRQITEPVCVLSVPGDMSPVVSVAAIAADPGQPVQHGGVISCKLNSLCVYESINSEYKLSPLPLDGPFISMKYQNSTKQLLVSTRPNARTPYARHILCNIQNAVDDTLSCNVIHTFIGGGMQKLLTRSCFLSGKNDYVAAHHETNRGVFLWSVNTGHKVCSVPAHEPILDLCGVQTNTVNYLLCLTEKKIEFFKFLQ